MMRLRLGLVAVIVLLLQVGFWPALRPFGVVPDMMLGLVVLVGLAGTTTAALTLAVVGGVLLDLTSGVDFGLRLGLLVVVALVASMVHRSGLTLTGPIVAWGVVVVATIVHSLVVWIGVANMVVDWPLGVLLAKLGLEIMINLGLTWLVMPVVQWAVAPSHTGLVDST